MGEPNILRSSFAHRFSVSSDSGCESPQLVWGELTNGLFCLGLPASPGVAETSIFQPNGTNANTHPLGLAKWHLNGHSMLFITDYISHAIYLFNMTTLESSCNHMMAGSKSLPNRLAVDHSSQLLYFTDLQSGRPAVRAATFDMSMTKDIILTDLQNPEDIALLPSMG